ncbi:two-component regulator propeller domain-containing protein [Haliscomenobacter sp.]|uniref:ligand-binding sensor domain-containing protein n=1 Tax=Haliscomenobacter sp. TaxID=2717303 RepID=UPI0035945ACD
MKPSSFFKQIPLLFLSILISSCNGQVKNNSAKDKRTEPNPVSIWQKDLNAITNDPYFVETKTINAPFGPQSITRNMVQDKSGNLWLASWEGIIRYDGKTFTNFTNQEGLRRFHVFSTFEDKKGNLWFGTIRAGVYRYNGKTFTNFTTRDGLADDQVGSIVEDKRGNIWFGTAAGVSYFDGKKFHNFTTKEGLIDNDVNSIIEDKRGNIWVGTRGGVCYYNGKIFTRVNNQAGLPFNNVRSIIEDYKGNLWIGGQDGLFRYNGKSFTTFSTDFIGFLYPDKQGNIWISAGSPQPPKMVLYRYDGKSEPLPAGKKNYTEIHQENGQIFGIMEDKQGNIWFGTERGVCHYDGKTFKYFKE